MQGCFIMGIDGKEVEVTCTIEEAIAECKEAIDWLENKDGLQFPYALRDWQFKLKQLEQIRRDSK